jgi:hypothetical protein
MTREVGPLVAGERYDALLLLTLLMRIKKQETLAFGLLPAINQLPLRT